MRIETIFVHPMIATGCSKIRVKPAGICWDWTFFRRSYWVMLSFWRIALFKDRASTAAPSVWYSRALFQTAHFCNKFQVNLFLFQWFGPVFLSSSSPKVGICSNRSNLHSFSLLRFVPVLWIIDKNCNKIIEPATNNYVVHTPAIY